MPFLLITVARPAHSPQNVVLADDGSAILLTPVDRSIHVRAVRRGETVLLVWSAPAWRAGVSYRVMRTRGDGPDTTCTTAGVTSCLLDMETLTETRGQRYVDGSPPPGVTYRIGVTADYRNSPAGGDMFAVSPPLRLPR